MNKAIHRLGLHDGKWARASLVRFQLDEFTRVRQTFDTLLPSFYVLFVFVYVFFLNLVSLQKK